MERAPIPEQLITLPRTGLRVIPPVETQQTMNWIRNIAYPVEKTAVSWSEQEKARLRLLTSNPIYRKRHPSPERGKVFMQEIDYGRRETLFTYAQELSDEIVTSWEQINEQQAIAVIVFGSVATGLVKHAEHPCPSNIDMAVLGDFTAEERLQLYDAIRPKRLQIQAKILADCPNVQSDEKNPGNAGVTIQHRQKVINGDYCGALEYIGGNARTLHDPAGIWSDIEKAALDSYIERQEKKRDGSTIFYRKGR